MCYITNIICSPFFKNNSTIKITINKQHFILIQKEIFLECSRRQFKLQEIDLISYNIRSLLLKIDIIEILNYHIYNFLLKTILKYKCLYYRYLHVAVDNNLVTYKLINAYNTIV